MAKIFVMMIATAALAVVALLMARSQTEPGDPRKENVQSANSPPTSSSAGNASVTPSPPRQNTSSAPESAADAISEIARILPAARDGDVDAQFRLYEMLAGCQQEYALYFSKGPRLLDANEAAIRRDALRALDDYAVEIYDACHRLVEEQPALLSQADDWFEKAFARHHPKAQTVRAATFLNLSGLQGSSDATRKASEGRALLAKAVTTGDAYALWVLGELRPALGGSAEDTDKERWAMQLASCDRGFDCRPESKWVKRYCKADPASLCPINANAEEMIRSKTGSDFEMIKMRAKEINAIIDAGKGAELVPQSP